MLKLFTGFCQSAHANWYPSMGSLFLFLHFDNKKLVQQFLKDVKHIFFLFNGRTKQKNSFSILKLDIKLKL